MNAEFCDQKAKGTKGISQADELSLELMLVDLASFKSVMTFTKMLLATGRPIHVLFCNAGEGFEKFGKYAGSVAILV